MFKLIKSYIFAWRYKRAVKQAVSLADATGLRHYVIYINRSIKVVQKRTIKELIRRRRFRKGVTIADIERCALFVTK
jgi:hypothetical protein